MCLKLTETLIVFFFSMKKNSFCAENFFTPNEYKKKFARVLVAIASRPASRVPRPAPQAPSSAPRSRKPKAAFKMFGFAFAVSFQVSSFYGLFFLSKNVNKFFCYAKRVFLLFPFFSFFFGFGIKMIKYANAMPFKQFLAQKRKIIAEVLR